MDESKNNYADLKKPARNIHTIWFYLYKIPENVNYCMVTKPWDVVAQVWNGGECRDRKGKRKGLPSGMMCEVCTLS